ncbi:MAG: hypothetical protein MI974_03135 [Chitinophagales bacterium]|nr:hypothetical protein [Chitinophagales bacterium]
MKAIKFLSMLLILFYRQPGMNQESGISPKGYWQIGLGLGELLIGGSFKSSVTNMYKVFHIGLAYRFQ